MKRFLYITALFSAICITIFSTIMFANAAASIFKVGAGGTGTGTFGQGWIFSNGGTGALAASTSPTVDHLVATSTTATNIFNGQTNFTNGFISQASSTVTGQLTLATTTTGFLNGVVFFPGSVYPQTSAGLQQAVNLAHALYPNYGVVDVAAGTTTFNSSIVLPSNMRVHCDSWGSVLDGSTWAFASSTFNYLFLDQPTAGTTTNVMIDNCKLVGAHVETGAPGQAFYDEGVVGGLLVRLDGFTFEHNYITETYGGFFVGANSTSSVDYGPLSANNINYINNTSYHSMGSFQSSETLNGLWQGNTCIKSFDDCISVLVGANGGSAPVYAENIRIIGNHSYQGSSQNSQGQWATGGIIKLDGTGTNAGIQNVVIDGNVSDTAYQGITMSDARNVVISNNIIKNASSTAIFDNSVDVKYVTINGNQLIGNNTSHDSNSYGIYSPENSPSYWNVYGNTIDGGVAGGKNQISFPDAGDQNVEVTNNEIGTTSSSGIYYAGTNALIMNNRVKEGINIFQPNSNSLINNPGSWTSNYAFDVTGSGHFSSYLDASYFIATSSGSTSQFLGNLTLGTTTPGTNRLTVNGDSTFYGGTLFLQDLGNSGISSSRLKITETGGTNYIESEGANYAGTGELQITGTNASPLLMDFATNGNIGIASSTPGTLFSINGIANFSAATSTFYGTGGISIAGGCFKDAGGCLTHGGGGTVTSVSGTWPVLSSGGNTPTISWGGISTTSNLVAGHVVYSTGVGTIADAATTTLAGGGPITVSNTPVVIGSSGAVLGCTNASNGVTGCMSAADWGLLHTATTTFSAPFVYSGSTNAVTCTSATGSVTGCLTSTDWTTFNNKNVNIGATSTVPLMATYFVATSSDQTATTTLQSTLIGHNQSLQKNSVLNVVNQKSGQSAVDIESNTSAGIGSGELLHLENRNASDSGNALSILGTVNSASQNALFVQNNGQAALPSGDAIAQITNSNGSDLQGGIILKLHPTGNQSSGIDTLVTDGGLVGFGTTTPWGFLSLAPASTTLPTFVDWFSGSSSPAFIIDSANHNGNVGIATTTPGSLLSIQGIANFTTATSTFYGTGGVNIEAGCFAINNNCLTQNTGTITGVTAGTGLSGGGTSGTVTLNLSTPVSIANGGTATTTGGNSNALEYYNGTTLTNSNHLQTLFDSTGSWLNIPYLTAAQTNGIQIGLGDEPSYIWQNYGSLNDTLNIAFNYYKNNAGTDVVTNAGQSAANIQIGWKAANGSGTLGGIGFQTGNGAGNVPANRMVILDSGNVGIGTNAPTYLLDVNGVGHFNSTVDAQNFVATSTSVASTIAYRLGMGTSSPAEMLELNNSANSNYTTESLWNNTVHMITDADSVDSFNGITGFAAIGTKSNHPFVILNNNAPALGIYSDNGLDTLVNCKPPANGSECTFTDTVTLAGGVGDIFTDWTTMNYSSTGLESSINVSQNKTAPLPTFIIKFWQSGAWGPQSNATSSTPFFIASSTGNVAIGGFTVQGVETANQRGSDFGLQKARGVVQLGASSTAAVELSVFTGSTTVSANEAFTVLQTGNVGVGTTTPGSLLSINGIANFTAATSTLYGTGGINLAGGCFAIKGACVGGSGGGSGTVTNVATDATLTGGPITTTGTLGINLNNYNHWNNSIDITAGNGWYNIEGSTFAYASSTNFVTTLGIGAGGQAATTSATATYMTAIGYHVLQADNSSGLNNTGMGYGTLVLNTSGSQNTAMGVQALPVEVNGNYNTAIGYKAQTNVGGGSNNTCVGSFCLQQTNGTGNVTLGYDAGYNLTGSANIILGQNVDAPAAGGSGQLNIGNVLFGTGLFNNSGNGGSAIGQAISGSAIGISTTTPWAKLSIAGDSAGTIPLFSVSTSTASATTTVFQIDKNGNVTTAQNGATLTLGTALAVGSGGTGGSTFTTGTLLVGNGTGAIGNVADVGTGQVLTSGGVSANPSYSASPSLTSMTLGGNLTFSKTNEVRWGDDNAAIFVADGPTNLTARNNVMTFRLYNGSSADGVFRFVDFNNNNKVMIDAFYGTMGIATTTAQWPLTVASSTGPQIGLVDTTNTSNAWTLRSVSNNFYIATSSYQATSSVAAFSISSNDKVAIPQLVSCGGILTSANGVLSCTSDAKLKDIHQPFTTGLSAILNIAPQAWSWKKSTDMYDGGVVYYGFVAQNVQKAIPQAVNQGRDGLQISMLTILATVVNAIKDLAHHQSTQDKEIQQLQAQVKAQQVQINELLKK